MQVGENSRLETLPIPLFRQGEVEMLQAAFQVRVAACMNDQRSAPLGVASIDGTDPPLVHHRHRARHAGRPWPEPPWCGAGGT
jgi:hypothetical protein